MSRTDKAAAVLSFDPRQVSRKVPIVVYVAAHGPLGQSAQLSVPRVRGIRR